MFEHVGCSLAIANGEESGFVAPGGIREFGNGTRMKDLCNQYLNA